MMLFLINKTETHRILTVLGLKFKIRRKSLLKSLYDDFNAKSHSLNLYNEELLLAQIFNNLIQSTDWIEDKKFIPVKGAANYSLLYILYVILENIAPERILEFGMGQTSKLTAQYAANKNQQASLQIIDHDKDWLDYFSAQLPSAKNIKLVHKPLKKFTLNGVESDKYEDLNDVTGDNKYNLIIIDGPWGFDRVYPRTNILDLIPQNLDKDFVIILDDAERVGEQNTAALIFKKLEENNIVYHTFYKTALKTQCVITSESLKFLSFY